MGRKTVLLVAMSVVAAACVAALPARVIAQTESDVKTPHPTSPTSPRPTSVGTYAVWCRDDVLKKCLEKGLVIGGQVMVQWADIEPTEGSYDFSILTRKLQAIQALGRELGRNVYTTVQVNGNVKPDYLYRMVPHHKSYTKGRSDGKQVLMFWHPEYIKAHLRMIEAFAHYLKTSPYRSCIAGIRQSYNAFGTEGYHIPGMRRAKRAAWIVPEGVTVYDEIELVDGNVAGKQSGQFASPRTIELYKAIVVDKYLKCLAPDFLVFVRNTMPRETIHALLKTYGAGSFGLFHTSSHVEPLNAASEREKWEKFLEFCRPGMVPGYAETWADAFGSGKWVPWCSPPQKNYWRILCDLHCGVSYLAFYGTNLEVAADGVCTRHGKKQDCRAFQKEFLDAIMFARKYAGFHCRPAESPGAWIAFRDAPQSSYQYNAPSVDRRLRLLNSDYTFLMRRIPGDGSVGVRKAGPGSQRYGAWARKLSDRGHMKLVVNPVLAGSMEGATVDVKVIYLDEGYGAARLSCSGKQFRIECRNTGQWQEAQFPISHAHFNANTQDADVVVQCVKEPVVLHMIEIER